MDSVFCCTNLFIYLCTDTNIRDCDFIISLEVSVSLATLTFVKTVLDYSASFTLT